MISKVVRISRIEITVTLDSHNNIRIYYIHRVSNSILFCCVFLACNLPSLPISQPSSYRWLIKLLKTLYQHKIQYFPNPPQSFGEITSPKVIPPPHKFQFNTFGFNVIDCAPPDCSFMLVPKRNLIVANIFWYINH